MTTPGSTVRAAPDGRDDRGQMTMEHKSSFPVVVTSKIAEARDFYVNHLGFQVVFEADWYVQLYAPREGGGKPVEMAFMKPDQEPQPAPLHPAFNGIGVIFTLEVDDVDLLYLGVRDAGRTVTVKLRDEPWG